jgi:histidinol-phosphate aminotransferase
MTGENLNTEFLAAPHIEAIPATTPFIGPEQLMRERGFSSLIRLGANESSFGVSPKAVAAMAAELPRLAWYGDPESYDLRSALAQRHGCGIENICIGSGIDELMGLAVRAFTSPGSAALATRGTYPTFAYHVTGYGAVLDTVPYTVSGRVDADALIARARDTNPSMVYLANPDNPSGTLLGGREIESIFAALPQQTLLLLDEAYIDFAPQPDVPETFLHPRLLRMRTFSKAYGMAGARIGYTIATARNVQTFEKIRLQYGVNRNAQIGALAALQDEAFTASVVAAVAKGREEYYELARSLGRHAIESHTNFVCIDFDTAPRAAEMVRALLARGVFIRKPGAPPLDRYIRVSVGTAEERAEFAARLRDAAAELAA